MPDAQITVSAVSAAPANYTVSGAADWVLKAVNADMDGSGAGSAWLPCVTIISDSGHVVARAVDQAVSVAAGASAEVSWFPGVKHAAAAASGGLAQALAYTSSTDPVQVFADSSAATVRIDHFSTSDASVYELGGVQPNSVAIKASGIYLVRSFLPWPYSATPYYHYGFVSSFASFDAGSVQNAQTNESQPTEDGSTLAYSDGFTAAVVVSTLNLFPYYNSLHLRGYQASGVDKTVSFNRGLYICRMGDVF